MCWRALIMTQSLAIWKEMIYPHTTDTHIHTHNVNVLAEEGTHVAQQRDHNRNAPCSAECERRRVGGWSQSPETRGVPTHLKLCGKFSGSDLTCDL